MPKRQNIKADSFRFIFCIRKTPPDSLGIRKSFSVEIMKKPSWFILKTWSDNYEKEKPGGYIS